ncbi:MAG: cytochrome c-type biogenesis protein CcmH [Alphaproteobacteria bacterium]
MRYALLLAVFMFLAAPARAVHPDEVLKDPVLEARARVLTKELRCLVCQGEDIDESEAPLAADLRRLVRERLAKGDTDAEVLAHMQDRYGDYILMNPPLSFRTLLLWGAPALVLAVGLGVVVFFVRRQPKGEG